MKTCLFILLQCFVFQLSAQTNPSDKCQQYYNCLDMIERSVSADDDMSIPEKKTTIKMYKDSVRRLKKEIMTQGPGWDQCKLRFFHEYANQLTWNMRYKKARTIYLQLYALERRNVTWLSSHSGYFVSNNIYSQSALDGLSTLYFYKKKWFNYAMFKWFRITLRKQKVHILCASGDAELQSKTDHKRIRKLKKKESTRMALDFTCQIGVYINSSIFEPYQMEDIYYELLRKYYTAAEIKEELDRNLANIIQKRIELSSEYKDLKESENYSPLCIPVFDTYIYLSIPYEVTEEKGLWENSVVREVLLHKLYHSYLYNQLRSGK